MGCSKEPMVAQQELVDRLIQEQIDIPYKEQNWELVKDKLAEYGETVKQAADRNKKLYMDIHNYLIALKNKPYKDKKTWAINMLGAEIELFDAAIKRLEKPDEKLVLQFEQRKKWLALLRE